MVLNMSETNFGTTLRTTKQLQRVVNVSHFCSLCGGNEIPVLDEGFLW